MIMSLRAITMSPNKDLLLVWEVDVRKTTLSQRTVMKSKWGMPKPTNRASTTPRFNFSSGIW